MSGLPRVEQRRWNGPGSYCTTHWVVLTETGELLNAKRRIKKFRSEEAATKALSAPTTTTPESN